MASQQTQVESDSATRELGHSELHGEAPESFTAAAEHNSGELEKLNSPNTAHD